MKVMVQFDKGFNKEERTNMKKLLVDSSCQCDEGKCLINCEGLHICDVCYDEDSTLTPFCLWTMTDVIYGHEIIRDKEGDTVCESHGHEEVGSEPELDKRMICPKCGFKTDSEIISH